MKYIKINPFDFYLLMEKKFGSVDIRKTPPASPEFGEVTISISGGAEPYSYKTPLIKFDGVLYLRTSTVPPSYEALAKFETPEIAARLREFQSSTLQTVTYDPESEPDEKLEFLQKLGLPEYHYDRVFAFKHLPDKLAEPFFKEAVNAAQDGKKVLWECAPESKTKWCNRFVEALCATWRTNRGVEVGPRDPSF
jgi:hypothetical protein